MSNKKILELVLKTAGFTMANFQLIRGGSITGYEFEVYRNGKCEFQVATDSFEAALSDTMEGIYGTLDVEFSPLECNYDK